MKDEVQLEKRKRKNNNNNNVEGEVSCTIRND